MNISREMLGVIRFYQLVYYDIPGVQDIGNNNPEKLMVFITSLEKALSNSLGREIEFEKIYEPIKPGDVPATYAATDKLNEAIGFKPETSIQDGLQKFTDWYVEYYNKK